MDDTDDIGQSPLWHEFDQFLAYIAVNPGHRPLALEPGVGGASSSSSSSSSSSNTDAMDVLEVRSVDWQTAQNVGEMEAGLLTSEDLLNESLPMNCENDGVFGSWNNFSDALLETTLNTPPNQGAKVGYAVDLEEPIAVLAPVVEKPTTKEIALTGGPNVLNTEGTRKRKRVVDKSCSNIKLLLKLASSIADLQAVDDATDKTRDLQKKLKLGVVEEVAHEFTKPDSPEDSKIQSDKTLVALIVSDFDAICKLAITHAALEERAGRCLPRVKLNPQPVFVCNSGSKPDAAYRTDEPHHNKPKSKEKKSKAQSGLPPVPPIQKRKKSEGDSMEVVQRKKLKPNIPLPLCAPNETKDRATSTVPMMPSIQGGHRMKTRAFNMDVTPSTSGTAGSPAAELPKQSVDGRRHPNVPSKYRCGTCHKTYLGNRMQNHQTANPTHRTVAQLEGETSKDTQGGDVQPFVGTEPAPIGRDKGQSTGGRLNQLLQIVSAEPEPNRTRLMQEFWHQMCTLTPNLTGDALTGVYTTALAAESGNPNVGYNEQNKTLHHNAQLTMQVDQDNSAPGGPVMGGGLVQTNVRRAMEVNATLLGRMDTPPVLPNVSILDELMHASGAQLLDDLSVLELDQHDLF